MGREVRADDLGAMVEDAGHRSLHEERMSDIAERAERKLVLDVIAHARAARDVLELVGMTPYAIRPA